MNRLKPFIKRCIRIIGIPFILKDYYAFKKADQKITLGGADKDANKTPRFTLSPKNFFPQIKDKTIATGFDRHYVYHTAWAIRKVRDINPKKHIDVSSSLYFCTHISAFFPTEFYDYRPAELSGLDGLKSMKGDLMHLPFATDSIESISCMHTIEHIGLGRYGDPIDPNGDVKAIEELKRVVARGGSLLFVTPVGKPIIEFNAHRIYAYQQIIDMFTKGPNALKLHEFSLIRESKDGLIANATKEMADAEHYACGCFWFTK
jgi:SAM-dependent methyltransferase